jgi:hypothetical protein
MDLGNVGHGNRVQVVSPLATVERALFARPTIFS